MNSLDLFGAPPRERAKWERSRTTPTAATRILVRDMLCAGQSVQATARALGITKPTLRRHYGPELASRLVMPPLVGVARSPAESRPFGAGRQPHRPTDETRAVVAELRAMGWPVWQIAQTLRVAAKTVWAVYGAELHSKAPGQGELTGAGERAAAGGPA